MVKIMDLRRNGYLILLLVLLGGDYEVGVKGENNVVFNVKHKFGGRGRSVLKDLKDHDARRHGRMLAAADFQLGGNGSPTGAALYFTKLSIGTPSKDYHVQVDTGSDLFWVNCARCLRCPTKSKLGIDLVQYDLQASTTGKSITCEQDVCSAMFNADSSECKVGKPCEYLVTYGDGSSTGGYFVKDNIYLDQVSGDYKTSSLQGTVAFGCSSQQSGDLGTSTNAVDGIIGFGEANSSVISQLAAAGTVKKMFAHCLDGVKGGGIFAIGQVVEPKVNSAPLVPNRAHYTVSLKDIEVGREVLDIPTSLFESKSSKKAIIDSGTTLVYLPSKAYNALMNKLMSKQPQLKTHHLDGDFDCFIYSGNVDDGFPAVTFQFVGNLSLTAYPHDYLFQVRDNEWCIGWQEGTQGKDGNEIYLLGDLLLSNKLVLYDLEKQTIGWTQYDCSSSIKVKDETSGNVYTVGAHKISSASNLDSRMAFTFFLSIISFLCFLLN
ncbi:aspartic proteinase 36-like isoform X1 [Nicotiana tomentosiformis]|uniref:aspartic proteinase 36-like isoform X1 n=1 Tax=Nicotiana tomentosiformis TaxID=4098 RepID=UPI00051C45B0|nr:aspartic proteinase-like protein 2 [Nicotiana tomentosiformis]